MPWPRDGRAPVREVGRVLERLRLLRHGLLLCHDDANRQLRQLSGRSRPRLHAGIRHVDGHYHWWCTRHQATPYNWMSSAVNTPLAGYTVSDVMPTPFGAAAPAYSLPKTSNAV